MVCIYCGAPTQVINSRVQRRLNNIWRRRKCKVCAAIFTTEERAALHASLMVALPAGRLAPFSRDYLFTSVHDSCRHRPSAIDDATSLTQTIITSLVRAQHNGIVTLEDIARATHALLQRFDPAAATVYAAYHPLATAKATS